MNVIGNKQSSVPPGFRFHPTEEELLNYYLRKKLTSDTSGLDFICDIDLNKLEPWDIQDKCRIGTWPQNEWYLFSNNGKKYLYGTRTNRATGSGFWKATGRDKVIRTGSSGCIGLRKTLVFYQGRAPHSRKSDWIMHEYRLDDNGFGNGEQRSIIPNYSIREAALDEGWVVCRVFKKKSYFHSSASDNRDDNHPVTSYFETGKLDNINIGICNATPGKSVFDISTIHEKLMQLPTCCDWATLDKFVANQLNGTLMPDNMHAGTCDEQGGNGDDGGLWSLI